MNKVKVRSHRIVLLIFASAFFCVTASGEQGDDSPYGVAGSVSGFITTGCGIDPYSGNAHREIVDLAVPGAVGAYGLKWTRYWNSHTNYKDHFVGALWRFSYINYSFGGGWPCAFPDGRVLTPDAYGMEEFVTTPYLDGHEQDLHLADGGKVIFTASGGGYPPTALVDPYGLVTTIVTTGSDSTKDKKTKITEPGGRYLLVTYDYNTNPISGTVIKVEAYDSPNATQPIQWVSYQWHEGKGGPLYPALDTVTYSDGTHAAYNYVDVTLDGPCPQGGQQRTKVQMSVVSNAADVRYSGPMRQIAYQYDPGGNGTRVIAEQNLTTSAAVTSIAGTGNDNLTIGVTETRGDSTSSNPVQRSLSYYKGPEESQQDCNQDVYSPSPPDAKLHTITDYLGNTTTITYYDDGSSAGFINSVTDPNNHTTTYARQTESWGITKITHPDGKYIKQTFWGGPGDTDNQTQPYYLASRTDEMFRTTTYTRDSNNRISRKDDPDGTYETFSYDDYGFGLVKTHRMTNGAYQHFQYDSRGLLLAKTNPTWNPDHDGSLSSDPVTTYSYYPLGDAWVDRVQTEIDPRGNATTYEYDYAFDPNTGNVTTTHAASRGLVTKLTHVSDGTHKSLGYDKYGDKVLEVDELNKPTTYAYDEYGRLISITDPFSHTTTHYYNKPSLSPFVTTFGEPFKTVLPPPASETTTTTYDNNWRKTSVAQEDGTSNPPTTYFHYDEGNSQIDGHPNIGRLTSTIDPRGNPTTYEYDPRDRKVWSTDPLGLKTVYEYDDVNNLTAIDRPDGFSETKTYDTMHRVLTDKLPKDNPNGNLEIVTTTFDYYPGSASQMAGELMDIKDSKQQITTFTYDPAGHKTQMAYPDNSTGHADFQAWTYDADYNLIARQTVNGATQLFSYDSRNRQISMTWSNGADWATFGYDAVGRMTNALNRSSAITRIYDDAGRMTDDEQQLQFIPVSAVSRMTHGSAGTFDITLPLVGTPGVECRADQQNPGLYQIVATFPRTVVSVGNASVFSGTGSVSTFSFSANQVTINLTGVGNAQTITVTLSGVSDGTASSNVNIGMAVLLGDVNGDGKVDGNDVSLVQQQGRASVSASNFRSDVNVTGIIDGNDVSLTQSETRTSIALAPMGQAFPVGPLLDVHYGYDNSNRLTSLTVTSPNHVTTNYSYTFGYDTIDRFNAISNASGQLFGYQYDAASNETHRTGTDLANGIDQVYTIDPYVNRIDERDLGLNGTSISSEFYSYDDGNGRPGLLTSIAHYEERLSPQWSEDTFGYDLLPELTVAQYNWQQQSGPDTSPPDPGPGFGMGPPTLGGGNTGSDTGGLIVPPLPDPGTWVNPQRSVNYTWDQAGNRITMNDGNTAYNYGTTNLNQYWTDGTSNGNITPGTEHELANYRDVDYAYINDTHLSSISGRAPTYPTAPVYQLSYDALGRCVIRSLTITNTDQTTSTTTNYYIYDGEKPILEYNPGYLLLAANLYGKGIDEILMRTTYGALPGDADSSEDTTDGTDGTYAGDGTDGTAGTARNWYYQDDHEGSITQLTNVNGDIVEWYRYDAFGAPTMYNQANVVLTHGSNFANRFLFTGREYMASFAIYEYRNRAYHPGLGRFMSEDPKGFVHRAGLGKEPDKWDFFQHPDDGELNLFRYCGNDPEDWTDPMGEEGLHDFVNGFDDFATFGLAETAMDAVFPGYSATVDRSSAAFHSGQVAGVAVGALDGSSEVKGFGKLANAYRAWRAERMIARTAYKIAAEGGKHSGLLKNYEKKTFREVEKAIKSKEAQVVEHRAKIADPQKVPGFKGADPRAQKALLDKIWPNEIQTEQEEIAVLRGLLEKSK